MPYIEIKAYPRDAATKQRLAEKLNAVVLEELGCSPSAVTISMEDVAPEDWTSNVVCAHINHKLDKMLILNGEKKY